MFTANRHVLMSEQISSAEQNKRSLGTLVQTDNVVQPYSTQEISLCYHTTKEVDQTVWPMKVHAHGVSSKLG